MTTDQLNLSSRKIKSLAVGMLFPLLALTMTGCWTPPNANVQPVGDPRMIQSDVHVKCYNLKATVSAVDNTQHTIQIKLADGTMISCTGSADVSDFSQVKPGDQIKVDLAADFTVYLLKGDMLPMANGKDETVSFTARIQTVDPSYRLAVVQFVNGQTKEFKFDLDAKMLEMAPGDAVVMQNATVKSLDIEKD
jgi:hypothetical protein